MTKKASIMEIFSELDYEEEKLNYDGRVGFEEKVFISTTEAPVELVETLKCLKPVKFCEQVTESALKAQKAWGASSPQLRANTLHKIWEYLNNILELFLNSKDDLSLFIDYFDFYCDVLQQGENYIRWRPKGPVLIVLSDCSPVFVAAATIPAALVGGCSVIVSAPKTVQAFLLFLEAIFLKASLPEGVFKVVTALDEVNDILINKMSKVFLCGSYSSVQKFYTNTLVHSFNFFCPNNTAAFVLESADLDAAVDKIISETWGKEDPFFAISNIVVQESIYKKFFDILKYKMNQFMTLNNSSIKFMNKTISEKIQEVISKALTAGASVEEVKSAGEWNPTVIINYQSQDIDQDVPILKLLLCRTAKEGIALLNNCRYTLGTSVWSEMSSQALEISSKLISPNVWINCHGEFHAAVPLQLYGFSGNCVIGGSDGILEFMSLRVNDAIGGLQENEDKEMNYQDFFEQNGREAAALAQHAFETWQYNKNRRLYLKKIANSLSEHVSDIIHYYAHSRYVVNFSDMNPSGEFSLVKKKIPIGVILLIINPEKIDKRSTVSIITPALALGNAVMVVLMKEDALFHLFIKSFINILPKNLLKVVVGMKHAIHLVSDPNIQAIWLYNELSISKEFLEKIRYHSARNLKRFWIAPEKVPISHQLFQKECLQNKIVWLTKMESFP